MAGIAGIRGDKNKGLEMLAEAGNSGGETSTDARVTLGLFLRRGHADQETDDVIPPPIPVPSPQLLFSLLEGKPPPGSWGRPPHIFRYLTLLSGMQDAG